MLTFLCVILYTSKSETIKLITKQVTNSQTSEFYANHNTYTVIYIYIYICVCVCVCVLLLLLLHIQQYFVSHTHSIVSPFFAEWFTITLT